jgi:hypothetical protein
MNVLALPLVVGLATPVDTQGIPAHDRGERQPQRACSQTPTKLGVFLNRTYCLEPSLSDHHEPDLERLLIFLRRTPIGMYFDGDHAMGRRWCIRGNGDLLDDVEQADVMGVLIDGRSDAHGEEVAPGHDRAFTTLDPTNHARIRAVRPPGPTSSGLD